MKTTNELNQFKPTESYSNYAEVMKYIKTCNDLSVLKCMLLDAIENHYAGEDIIEIIRECYIQGGN